MKVAAHQMPGLALATRWIFALALCLMLFAVILTAVRRMTGPGGGRSGAMTLPARVRLRLHPGPGFARGRWTLWRQHGLPAARRSARRTRPGLSRRDRLIGPWREYATFIGWAHGLLPARVFAGFEQLQLVIAPPQKGKSAAAAGRIIDDPGPVIATSIRGDLIAATAALRQRAGDVHVFNPEGAGPYRSTFRWDPVAGCQDMATAARRAGYMVEAMTARGLEDASFWSDQASMILAALMHAAGLAGAGMREVYRWVLRPDVQPLQILAQHPAAAATAAHQVAQYLSLPERTRAGITTTLLSALRFMQVPEVAAMVCPGPGDGLDIAAFLRSTDTLYLVASDAAQSPVPPLFTALIAEIAYQARITGAAAGAPHVGGMARLDPPLTLELDEVANIAPIPLAAWATWAAGSGIRIHIYAQALAQLAERWGTLGAETIWQACDVKIIYAGSTEEDLCRKVEDACGQVQVRAAGRAQPGDAGAGPGWESRAVLPFAAIRQIPAGRAVVIRSGVLPVIVRTEQYWRRRDVRRCAASQGGPMLPLAVRREAAAPMPELMSAPAPSLPAGTRPVRISGSAARPPVVGPWPDDGYPQPDPGGSWLAPADGAMLAPRSDTQEGHRLMMTPSDVSTGIASACSESERILAALHQHQPRAGHLTPAFAMAAVAAASVRDAIIRAPSILLAEPRATEPGRGIGGPGGDPGDVADAIGAAAGVLRTQLLSLAAAAADPRDKAALTEAGRHAAEAHGYLSDA
jgi:type IV secretion system protein VirD4